MSPSAGSNSGNGASGNGSITIQTGVLKLDMEGGAIAETKQYTSMERFHTNDGKGYYVQLHPKPEPYRITYEKGNSAVKELADWLHFSPAVGQLHAGLPER